MQVKADTARVLMSDSLRGQVPELEDEAADQLEKLYVHVVVELRVGMEETTLVGILRSVLFDAEPELDFRVELENALGFVSANGLAVTRIQLHHGERVVEMPGPFVVKAARIDDIDVASQLCVLSVGLKRAPR